MENILTKKLISYSDVFNAKPNDDVLNEKLAQISTFSAIKWVSFLCFKKTQMRIDQQEHELFIPLLFKISSELKHTLCSYLQKINIVDYIFIDEMALLILMDHLLAHNNKEKDELTEEQFSKLMIAYLICCDKRINIDIEPKDLLKVKDINYVTRIILPEQLKINEIEYPKDYRTEFIRFYLFMQFCMNNDKYKAYLQAFLDEYNIKSWNTYLFFVFNLNLKMVTNQEGATNLIEVAPLYMFNYLKSMSIDTNNYISSPDFKSIRKKPILDLGENQYVIMYNNFFIDKMFQSFIFDFSDVLVKQEIIKNYGSLKSEIGYEFTEKKLFYTIMEGCFSKSHSILLKGDDIKKQLNNGEPDYYIRRANRVFLFEFKDVMLDADTKYSGDFDKIEKEILELFEWSTIERRTGNLKKNPVPKGITQLLNTIETKLSVILSKIDTLDTIHSPIYVFPIIIYQDCSFDIDGVNYILNSKFQQALALRKLPSNYIVKEVIMIPLNTLIELEDFFSSEKLHIGTIINEFIFYRNSCENNKIIPFNKFLMRKAQKKGYKFLSTNRFKSYLNAIIQEEK